MAISFVALISGFKFGFLLLVIGVGTVTIKIFLSVKSKDLFVKNILLFKMSFFLNSLLLSIPLDNCFILLLLMSNPFILNFFESSNASGRPT